MPVVPVIVYMPTVSVEALIVPVTVLARLVVVVT